LEEEVGSDTNTNDEDNTTSNTYSDADLGGSAQTTVVIIIVVMRVVRRIVRGGTIRYGVEFLPVPFDLVGSEMSGRLAGDSGLDVSVEGEVFLREERRSGNTLDLGVIVREIEFPSVVVTQVDVLAIFVVQNFNGETLLKSELSEGIILSHAVVGVADARLEDGSPVDKGGEVRTPRASSLNGIEGLGGKVEVVVVLQHSHVSFTGKDGGNLGADSVRSEEVIIIPMDNDCTLRMVNSNVALFTNRNTGSEVEVLDSGISGKVLFRFIAVVNNDEFEVGIILTLEEFNSFLQEFGPAVCRNYNRNQGGFGVGSCDQRQEGRNHQRKNKYCARHGTKVC